MENILKNYTEDDDLERIEISDENSMLKSIESEKLTSTDPTESIINITESLIENLNKKEADFDDDDYVQVNNAGQVGGCQESSSDTSSDESLIYQFRKKKIIETGGGGGHDSAEESSGDDEEEDEDVNSKTIKATKITYPKTKGEITLDELPAPDFQHFTLTENEEMTKIGSISSIFGNLIVVQSNRNSNPLDEETILFTENRRTIGKVYETFGPVCQPYYSIRVNLNQECTKCELNSSVYYVPKSQELTKYIFNIDQLKKLKGSDASWSNDNEPPVECLDFSDDEEEKRNKQRLKQTKNGGGSSVEETAGAKKPKNDYRQQQPRYQQQQQQQYRPRFGATAPFRPAQAFYRPQAQLINQSFQQMMSPNIYNMQPMQHNQAFWYHQQQQQQQQQFQFYNQHFNNPRAPPPPSSNFTDQRFIQNNEIKKSF